MHVNNILFFDLILSYLIQIHYIKKYKYVKTLGSTRNERKLKLEKKTTK